MIRKIFSVILAAVLVLSLFAGCGDTVNEIAGNVAQAAMEELEVQIKTVLEKNKLTVVEMKSAYGKLNDAGSENQFFCAALIQSNATDLPQAAADAVGKLVTEAGLLSQTGSKVDSEYLVHKDIIFKHDDFSSGNYYVIYAYLEDISVKIEK